MVHEHNNKVQREEQLDEVLTEYYQKIEAREPFDEEVFLASHAEFADELREFFTDKQRFDRAAEALSASAPAAPRQNENAKRTGDPEDPERVPPTMDAPPPRTPPAASVGRCLGDYELLEEVACGGMGIVYRARQRGLNRIVAVKMILAAQLASRSDVERFRREAEAAANLRHRNIVRIHEVDEQDGLHFFSMDFIEGKSLAAMVHEGPLPAEQAARYVKKVAEAIHYAHQQGILHRDLKPANVLVDHDDEPVITDFGLVKRMKADPQLTGSGEVVGTPSYMSPEQASGRAEIGPASDVYALGATLYELLTGRPPYRGETPAETVMDVLTAEPRRPRALNGNVPRDLETIVLKCLDKQPARRYSSAAALAEDLGRFLEGEPIRTKPSGLVRRSWHWIRGIPLVGALTGRTLTRPSLWQKRVQWITPLAVLLAASAFSLWPVFFPGPVVLYGGLSGPGYCYDKIAERLKPGVEKLSRRTVITHSSEGSNQNVRAVIRGDADLAITHLKAKSLNEGEVAILAPLYYAVVYVLVNGNIHEMTNNDFYGKNISLGPLDLGMRNAAEKILEAHGINVGGISDEYRDSPFDSILHTESMDGAIIATWEGHSALEEAFKKGFRPLSLTADATASLLGRSSPFEKYSVRISKEVTINTVRSPVVLIAKRDAPDRLVRATLDALYGESLAPLRDHLIDKQKAAEWMMEERLDTHREARKFYQDVLQETPSH